MEKHKCKLCLRSFANGRALGGHMRSHMMNLPVPPKQQSEFVPIQLSFEAESSPSQSSSSFYGLRENPKKSFRFADPEFSSAAASVILQDRESETESSRNPTRRRSKRAWQLGDSGQNEKKIKLVYESASSASDTTEEDVAFCLMMLSRDKWKINKQNRVTETEQQSKLYIEEDKDEEDEEDDYDDEDDDDDDDGGYESKEEELKSVIKKSNNKVRGRYKCETCEKVFRSYQALGGHRASHKKLKINCQTETTTELEVVEQRVVVAEKKIHECPVCFRVFASGQALGGHKRTHVIGSATTTATVRTATASAATVSVRTSTTTRVGDSLIDLNLPAPMDDDDDDKDVEDVSQFDDSAVSDAEFVKL